MAWAPKTVLTYLLCERTNHALDEHIIDELRNGNSALRIEECQRLSGHPFIERDCRMIRLLDIAYSLGYHLRRMQYGPEGVYGNLIRNENFRVWFPFARLSPEDQRVITQLILMLACLGYGDSIQEWIDRLLDLSRKFGNDDMIREFALSGLKNGDENEYKKDDEKDEGELGEDNGEEVKNKKKTCIRTQTIFALWKLENELLRSQIMEEWMKPHTKEQGLTNILMALMGEEPDSLSCLRKDRIESRNLFGGLDGYRDYVKANKKRYKHVRDYAKNHWHNAPVKGRREDLPEHTELESLMGAYNAGRDAAGRPIPEHPLLLKSGWMETRPEPTPIASGTHGPNDAKGECHEHSLLRDITVVEECQPAPQLDKREEVDEEDWKDAILNKPYNILGPASPDPNQTAYGESMEPHMLASPSLTDFFALGSISSNTERQLSIWSSLHEYDRSLVG